MKDLRQLRQEYGDIALLEQDARSDPYAQFDLWLSEAAGIADHQAMVLSTVDDTGMPSSRVVLLKHVDERGFAWYTDKRSQKGQELANNPQASLLFFWNEQHRQVRIQGSVSSLSAAEADEYYYSRPADSRFSAASSHQSQPIASRDALEQRVQELRAQYPNDDIPRPEMWGGYVLSPFYFEFWQGRDGRLHDRLTYRLDNDQWQRQRVQP